MKLIRKNISSHLKKYCYNRNINSYATNLLRTIDKMPNGGKLNPDILVLEATIVLRPVEKAKMAVRTVCAAVWRKGTELGVVNARTIATTGN